MKNLLSLLLLVGSFAQAGLPPVRFSDGASTCVGNSCQLSLGQSESWDGTTLSITGNAQADLYYFPGGDNVSNTQFNFNQLGAGSPYIFFDGNSSTTVFSIGAAGTPTTTLK